MSPQAAKLCARCQLLNFDEIKAGCSVALSSSGEEYLAIAEKWHQDRADAVELWELPVPGDPPVEFLDSLPLLPALEASATGSGCELCGFIRRGIRSQAMDSLRAGKKAISIQQFLGQAVQCTIQMSWTWCGERGQDKTDRNQTGFLYLNVKIAEVEEDGGVGQGVTLGFLAQATETSPELSKWLRIPAPSASPPEQWSESAAAEWSRAGIGQCMHEHSHVTEDFRPKRLIDIQSRPIRLVRSESLEAPVTYAALSYCWGSETDSQAQLRTDSNEIEAQLLLGFEERQLPAVVRDALEVARSLSIPYLWVDAICIRQDKSGDSDWEEHAGIMHRVYGNAHVTIAAASSSSCQEGFLRRSEPAISLDYHSTLRRDVMGHLKLTFDYSDHSHFEKFDLSKRQDTEELAYETYAWSKWSSRGWTLQEQVASTRLLAFGVKGNLFFSCPDGCWCFGREVEVSPFVSARQLGLDWTSFGCDSTSSSKWARLWRQLIFRYSLRARGFAYEQDIFPALSGIARSHSIATGMPETDYVAGFWRPSLLHDIFWVWGNIFDDKPLSHTSLWGMRFPQRYISPSWSWIRIGFTCSALRKKERSQIKPEYQRLDPHIVHKGGDPLGAISSAELRIVGKMATVPICKMVRAEDGVVSYARDVLPWAPDMEGGHCWHFYLDWNPNHGKRHRDEYSKYQATWLGKKVVPGHHAADFPETYMLLMASFRLGSDESEGERGLVGLLLHRVPSDNGQGNRFYRVGVFRTATPHPMSYGMEFFKGCTDGLVVIV